MTEDQLKGFRFRDTTRAPFSAEVRLRYDRTGQAVSARAADLSMEGMFVVSDEPKPIGTLVQFEFDTGSASEMVQGLGDVVWVRNEADVDRESGMGIQFRYVDPQSREHILSIVNGFIAAAAPAGSTAGSTPTTAAEIQPEPPPPEPIAPVVEDDSVGPFADVPTEAFESPESPSDELVVDADLLSDSAPTVAADLGAELVDLTAPSAPGAAGAAADVFEFSSELAAPEAESVAPADEHSWGQEAEPEPPGSLLEVAAEEPTPVPERKSVPSLAPPSAPPSGAPSEPEPVPIRREPAPASEPAPEASVTPPEPVPSLMPPQPEPEPAEIDPELPEYARAGAGQSSGAGLRVALVGVLIVALAAAGWWYRDTLMALLPGSGSDPGAPEQSQQATEAARPTQPPVPGVAEDSGSDPSDAAEDPSSTGETGADIEPETATEEPAGATTAGQTRPPSSEDPAPSVPAPVSATGGLTRLVEVSTAEEGDTTVVLIRGDGAIDSDDFQAVQLSSPPRLLVKLKGIGSPFSAVVQTPLVERMRSGVHAVDGGSELHLVFDLVHDDARAEVTSAGGTLRARISR